MGRGRGPREAVGAVLMICWYSRLLSMSPMTPASGFNLAAAERRGPAWIELDECYVASKDTLASDKEEVVEG